MNEAELREIFSEKDRVVAVVADRINPAKLAISVTADSGRWSQTDTLRLTRAEAERLHVALTDFLAEVPHD